jgi:hypothetical protein
MPTSSLLIIYKGKHSKEMAFVNQLIEIDSLGCPSLKIATKRSRWQSDGNERSRSFDKFKITIDLVRERRTDPALDHKDPTLQ